MNTCPDTLCPASRENRDEIKAALAKAEMFDEMRLMIIAYWSWQSTVEDFLPEGLANKTIELLARAHKLSEGKPNAN